MSDGPQQFPKREKGRVEVRHRTGEEAAARRGARPPEVEKIKGPRRKVDLDEEMGRRRIVRRFENETSRSFVLVSGSLCILMVTAVIWGLVIRPASKRKAAMGGGGSSSEVVRIEEEEVQVSSFVSNATAEELAAAIEAVVRGFMTSRTNEERCLWVNGGTDVLDKMREYYSREGVHAPNGFVGIKGSSALPFGGVPMQVVQGEASNDETPYLFNVFPGRERMLIDWESSVGYGEMSWESFLEEHPTEPVEMRIFLQPDDYYNYEFADDQKYRCFSLASKGSDVSVYGFVERGSDTEADLMRVVPPQGALPVRIRMNFLPWSVDKKMVWIEELIHPYWVDPVTIEEALDK